MQRVFLIIDLLIGMGESTFDHAMISKNCLLHGVGHGTPTLLLREDLDSVLGWTDGTECLIHRGRLHSSGRVCLASETGQYQCHTDTVNMTNAESGVVPLCSDETDQAHGDRTRIVWRPSVAVIRGVP